MSAAARLGALATALLAVAAGAALPAARARAGEVEVRMLPDTLRESEDGQWRFAVRIRNQSDFGLFGDSLTIAIRAAGVKADDPSAQPRRLMLMKEFETVSTRDSIETHIVANATAPDATIEMAYYGHDHTGRAVVARGRAIAAGSELMDRHPPLVVKVGGRDVEMIPVPAPAGAANGTGLLLLPGGQESPHDVLVLAWRYARQGVSSVIVFPPGSARSAGPADFAGPASVAGALAGLDTLLALPGVEPGRVGAWGTSRGGTLALRLALERPDAFRAVAAQSACYDLWAAWRAAGSAGRKAITSEAGRDSAAWRERSPLVAAADFKPALVVVHGEADDVFPPAPAHAFVEAVKAAGRTVDARFLRGAGHDLRATEAPRLLLRRLVAAP